jgi:hypothetical protein
MRTSGPRWGAAVAKPETNMIPKKEASDRGKSRVAP